MSARPIRPPFAEESPQAQLGPQPAPGPKPRELRVTRAMAERHEALWLALTALHKDVLALGAKKAGAAVPDGLRVAAEGLLSDSAPFAPARRGRLPVAAPDMAGLAVQLGQALAGLAAWESRHSFIDARHNCRMWRVEHGQQPIMRLDPPEAALPVDRKDMAELREKLAQRIDGRRSFDFQRGFEAGRAVGQGRPLAEIEAEFKPTYPRLRLFD